jgi:type VI secretion system protein ImpM
MTLTPGWYGKIPSLGDFASRRLPSDFIETWDTWLQHSMATSRAALGDRWLDIYLTSPAWRFVCAAGACGPRAVAGLIVPSVDRVGRYFPLTVVVELPAGAALVSLPQEAREFFDNGERILDGRTLFLYYATGITPAMSPSKPGVGSAYAYTARDSKGKYLDGGK